MSDAVVRPTKIILNRSGESWQFCAWSQWLEYQFSIVTYDVDIGFDVNCHYYLKAHFFHSNFIEFYFNLIMNGYLMLSKTLTKYINMFECFICLIVLIDNAYYLNWFEYMTSSTDPWKNFSLDHMYDAIGIS